MSSDTKQLQEKTNSELLELFEVQSRFCAIFTDAKRLRIMWLLKDGELSVGDISDALGIPITNVSQHLRIMRDQGAVLSRRDGRNVYYRLSNRKFIEGSALIHEGIQEELAKKGNWST